MNLVPLADVLGGAFSEDLGAIRFMSKGMKLKKARATGDHGTPTAKGAGTKGGGRRGRLNHLAKTLPTI